MKRPTLAKALDVRSRVSDSQGAMGAVAKLPASVHHVQLTGLAVDQLRKSRYGSMLNKVIQHGSSQSTTNLGHPMEFNSPDD